MPFLALNERKNFGLYFSPQKFMCICSVFGPHFPSRLSPLFLRTNGPAGQQSNSSSCADKNVHRPYLGVRKKANGQERPFSLAREGKIWLFGLVNERENMENRRGRKPREFLLFFRPVPATSGFHTLLCVHSVQPSHTHTIQSSQPNQPAATLVPHQIFPHFSFHFHLAPPYSCLEHTFGAILPPFLRLYHFWLLWVRGLLFSQSIYFCWRRRKHIMERRGG
jgi:hypothetical protein